MANFLERFFGNMGGYEDEFYDEVETNHGPSREEVARSLQGQNPGRREDGRVVNFRNPGVTNEVIIIEPRDITTAQQVCDYVRSGKTVICNIEQIDTKIAQRVIDFLTGATYALSGSVEPISSLIFVVAPRSTQVSTAEDINRALAQHSQRVREESPYRPAGQNEDVRRAHVYAR
ncbi:MAG: cell division protein SepF [Eubacteriales bacterium]|nr:cell division protein SepF [Eubacteriales bacterium]